MTGNQPKALDTIPPALDKVLCFNDDGLIPAIAQQHDTGEVLMLAWMNRDSILETLRSGQVCYWSRSRQSLWRKGESSGQVQRLVAFGVDCDGDTLLLQVEQTGVACHTGRRSCFFQKYDNSGDLIEVLPIDIDPENLYGKT